MVRNHEHYHSSAFIIYFSKRFCLPFLSVAILSLCGCVKENGTLAKEKLRVILNDDLRVIQEGIPKDQLLAQPYYRIVSYEEFKKGEFTKKAIVEFFFFKEIKVKIVRKYRYLKPKQLWERYFNEYSFLPDSALVPTH